MDIIITPNDVKEYITGMSNWKALDTDACQISDLKE